MKLIICLTLFLYSCNTLDGHRGISGSLKESKEKKVFKSKVEIVNALPEFKSVNNVWIENGWNYKGKNARVREGYETFIIEFKEKIRDYGTSWEIFEVLNTGENLPWEISGDSTLLFQEGDTFTSFQKKIMIIYKDNRESQIINYKVESSK